MNGLLDALFGGLMNSVNPTTRFGLRVASEAETMIQNHRVITVAEFLKQLIIIGLVDGSMSVEKKALLESLLVRLQILKTPLIPAFVEGALAGAIPGATSESISLAIQAALSLVPADQIIREVSDPKTVEVMTSFFAPIKELPKRAKQAVDLNDNSVVEGLFQDYFGKTAVHISGDGLCDDPECSSCNIERRFRANENDESG